MRGFKKHLDQLTGLRFFAALLVFVSHLNWENSNKFIETTFENGFVGVSFFFVLSGFVLSYSYLDKIVGGTITIKKYLFLRLSRLTPLYFATTMPFVWLALYEGNLDFFVLLSNLTYLQSWVPHSEVYFSFNSPSWSLSNEMFFYVCFICLAGLSLRSLSWVLSSLLSLVILSAVVVVCFFSNVILWGPTSLSHWLFYIFPGFRLLEFVVGMMLFRLWRKGYTLGDAYVLPAYALLFLAMYFANEIPAEFRKSLYFLPIISFFLYAHLHGGGLINKALRSKYLVLLGNASFAFYLIHQRLIIDFGRLLSPFNLNDYQFFVVSLMGISLLSIGTFLTYEKWAENKLKRIAAKFS